MIQKTNSTGIKLIQKYEGFVPYVYLDCVGLPTIGYGHLCREGDFYLQGKSLNNIKILCPIYLQKITKISKQQADDLLKADLIVAEKGVSRLIKVSLNSNQFSALVSFVYNLGAGALQRSALRQKLNRGEYYSVPYEMMKWVYAGGRRIKGLVRRRLEESLVFLG